MVGIHRGVLTPLGQWCISPSVSDFTPVSEKIQNPCKISPNFTFSWKIFRFSSAKISISDRQPQILNFPSIFAISVHFPPISTKLFFPLLFKISPCFRQKFTCFLTCFMCFSFPPTFTMMHLCITQCTYCSPPIPGILVDSTRSRCHPATVAPLPIVAYLPTSPKTWLRWARDYLLLLLCKYV